MSDDIELDENGDTKPLFQTFAEVAERMFGPSWERRAAEQLVMLHPSDAAAARQRMHAQLYGWTPHAIIIDAPMPRSGFGAFLTEVRADVVFTDDLVLESYRAGQRRLELHAKMLAVAAGASLSLFGDRRARRRG